MDTRLILKTATIQRAVQQLALTLDRDYADKKLALVGILSGAAYFLVDLSRALTIPHTVHFIQATSYHDVRQISMNEVHRNRDSDVLVRESQAEKVSVHGLSPKEIPKLIDRNVVVVDELYDNGKTLNSIVSYLRDEIGISSDRIRTCVALRKEKAVAYALPDYCGIDHLPDVFFYGYGLDDNGIRRNLNLLYAVPKPPGFPVSADEQLFTDESVYQAIFDRFNQ